MITRRGIPFAAVTGLILARRLAHAQATTPRRVGMLSLPSEAAIAHLRSAFTQGMADLGWRDAKNVEYRFAYADGAVERLDAKVAEMLGQRVEVIVAVSPAATRAAQRATRTIPIVMTSVSNAVDNGFVASLARPGGNITGTTNQQEEVLGKLIGLLHEIAPGALRMAIVLNEGNPSQATYWAAAQRACAALNLTALRVAASSPAQLGAAAEQIARQQAQAVVVVRDGMFLSERARLQDVMQALRLPVAYGFRDHVVAGGLISYAADPAVDFRYAAKYVDKILKGAKPEDLPVEQPLKFELVINLKTAKDLGLAVPRTMLTRADELLE